MSSPPGIRPLRIRGRRRFHAIVLACALCVHVGGAVAASVATPAPRTNATALKVAVSAGPNGSISPSRPAPVPYGGTLRLAITPKPGYHIDSLYVDDVPVKPNNTVTFRDVVENHSVRATFELNEYTLVASAGRHAHIVPVGPVTVKHGTRQSYLLSADPGYSIREVLIDGTPTRSGGTYTFSSVRDHHTIVARVAHNLASFVGPSPGEVWVGGETRVFHWQPVEAGMRDTVEVRVSFHGDDGPWTPIWKGLLRAGAAEWTVPMIDTDSLVVCLASSGSESTEGMDFSEGLVRVRSTAPGARNNQFFVRVTPSPAPVGPVRVEYAVPGGGEATLEIYTVSGRLVWRHVAGAGRSGERASTWDGKLGGGERAEPGVYFARLSTRLGERNCRLVLLP